MIASYKVAELSPEAVPEDVQEVQENQEAWWREEEDAELMRMAISLARRPKTLPF